MKIDPRIMQEFLEQFSRELARWAHENTLELIMVEMVRDPEEDDANEECFIIRGAVSHVLSQEAKSFQVGFGKRYKRDIPDDLFPLLVKVTKALTKEFWPDRKMN